MSNSVKNLSPEVRARAVRLVLDPEGEHLSRWMRMVLIVGKMESSKNPLGLGLPV